MGWLKAKTPFASSVQVVWRTLVVGSIRKKMGKKNLSWLKIHQPCPCGKSSDAYAEDDSGGKCFSCGEYFHFESSVDLNDFTFQYLDWRGIKANTFEKYKCPTKVNSEGKPIAIAFPYHTPAKDGVAGDAVKIRDLNEKKFFTQGSMKDATLFGLDLFPAGCADALVITEGELDALSSYQMSKLPSVSIRGASSGFKDCAANLEWINSFSKVYLCLDSDQPGREATARIANLLGNRAFDVKFQGQDKDANDLLKRGAIEEFNNVLFYARRFLPEEIVSSYNEVDRLLREAKKAPVITYPFKRIQEMTYGIHRGIVLITAQEGQGKTEIVRAIEAHTLRTTDYNIGVIHLEESKQRSIQGLAGYQLEVPTHLPDTTASIEDVFDGYKRITRRDERVYLINHFDGDDPNSALDLIRFLVVKCECKLVFLDHITQLVSALEGEDERKKLDYFSTKLEQMTQELDFSIIMVSHVNDDGKTRGSRYISKVANVRIDLQRDHLNSNAVERNKTYTTISKNRDGARTGPSSILYFNPDTFIVGDFDETDEFGENLSGDAVARRAA